jgi:predicted TIM-barrel fold metal-dependent hydrolase
LFDVKDVDRKYYADHLAGFLPDRMVDVHTHVYRKTFFDAPVERKRGAKWPSRVAQEDPIEDLLETYRLMFPDRQVTPIIFGSPRPNVRFEETNGYVTCVASENRFPSLMISTPAWSAEEVDQLVARGGFLGLKPYLTFAPAHLESDDITIFDFLPEHQLEVANERGWMVALHIPRSGRLKDPVNLEQMVQIERRFPKVKLVIAHVGRAYCNSDVGNAFEVLQDTEHMLVDFSANTNADVMDRLLRALGPQRVLFGSDLPVVRMRMRRICEGGRYINLVPPGLYGDVSDDPNMREVTKQEGEQLSYFLYEELWAFRRAAEAVGLSIGDVEDVCYNNAVRALASCGFTL